MLAGRTVGGVVFAPDGLTIKITTNVRKNTTRILAYRKGGFKKAYKAILPMCSCRKSGPHVEVRTGQFKSDYWTVIVSYHQQDITNLVRRIIKSYS
jgi:hypothetical protein